MVRSGNVGWSQTYFVLVRTGFAGRVLRLEHDPRPVLPQQSGRDSARILWMERSRGYLWDAPILDALGAGAPEAGMAGVHTVSGIWWSASLKISRA